MIPPEPLDESYTGMFAPSADGMLPQIYSIPSFGRQLKLAAPVLTPVAILIAHARYELGLGHNTNTSGGAHATAAAPAPTAGAGVPAQPLPAPPPALAAPAVHVVGPTPADIHEYETSARVIMPPRRDWADPDDEPSLTHDHDWARLVSCTDPFAQDQSSVLRSSVYEPGMLSGCFSGTIVTPDVAGYSLVLQDPNFSPGDVQWAGRPLHFRLREHHAIDGPTVLPGLDEREWGDDVLNAWLPRSMHMARTADELIVDVHDDEGGTERCRYATYHSNRQQPYSTHWTGVIREKTEEWEREGCEMMDTEEDEDGNVDFVSRTPRFVKDILVTGETDGRHGDAWGHYNIVGRVRAWDGLVVLLRIPVRFGSDRSSHYSLTSPQARSEDANHGRWVFRGYFHGGNLVGRWREAHVNDTADRLAYEGAFVLTRAPTEW
jgi:hypothetical protein